ncbi:hypothetical protein TMS3_0104970 [Pseudomonas taeanensis MS-3]|mgnify:CR=1 FL=1|jgi:hypothetical protein|uniref:Uncharacterized protein n=1 Tax=Pseudomonas taeanensis MS-3 TaxID=1395571 RepID=A0A0A1YQT6_9PSED|nr:hypothetical protein [Pseudomonas taeanensis]KFX71279.1 hypothetical protein TMS3_0104970 [Pseudomonas taeanensis MS-3]
MESTKAEQRQYHAMRAHIDQLLAKGWSISGRDPLRLESAGHSCIVRHGMLISDIASSARAA